MFRFFSLLLLSSILLLSPQANAAETTTVDGACTTGLHRADWDTIFQCVSSKWKRAAYWLGASSDTCPGHAGQIQWTGSAFQKCDGTSWTDLGATAQACDTSTILLLHMDGTNGSTTFTDSSGYETINPITDSGVTVNTTYAKFGTGSAYFNGSSTLTPQNWAPFNFGSNNYTIDFWMKASWAQCGNGVNGDYHSPFGNYSTSVGWMFLIYPLTGYIVFYDHASSPSSTTNVCDDAWHHVAVVRNGTSITLYIDGVANSTKTAANIPDSTYYVKFGLGEQGDGTTRYYKGYLDEVRITKGLARWTGNFTPPTEASTICETCPSIPSGSNLFTSSGTFTPPSGVSASCPLKARILAIGGGAGGRAPNNYHGGGGSGLVSAGSLNITSASQIPVTVGTGGASETAGGASSFSTVSAAGGSIASAAWTGGAGGSGGGAAAYSTTCTSFTGGAGGTNGANGTSAYGAGGAGQGSPIVASTTSIMGVNFSQSSFSAGSGGAGGTWLASNGSDCRGAGGGGGGLLINAAGPSGGQGASTTYGTGGAGGSGYGAGGGGDAYNGTYGGSGTSGAVYIEW